MLTGNVACGHNTAIVVGVSRRHPSLHVFTSVAHPDRPLELDSTAWRALLRSSGSATATELTCGDHGSDEYVGVRLATSSEGIGTRRLTCECTARGERGRLKQTEVS